MQNTNQEKPSYSMNQDLILGKKLEGGIKLSTVSNFELKIANSRKFNSTF